MMDDAVRERLQTLKRLLLQRDDDALKQCVHELAAHGADRDECVQPVVEAVDRGDTEAAVARIEAALGEDDNLTPILRTEDPSHRALQEEIEQLEVKLTTLEQEEAELQRRLRHFTARYREELGPLVSKLLRLRKDRLEQSLYARRGSRQRRTEYNAADAQFERFQHVLQEADDTPSTELSGDDQERLKATYRRASKLCHPDMVDESVEEEARTYFNELRDAYQRNDVEHVEAIAETLATTGFARRTDDAVSEDRGRLEARVQRLRRKIEDIEATLEEMRASSAYEAMTSAPDLDAYFDALKRKMRLEIRRLHAGSSVRHG